MSLLKFNQKFFFHLDFQSHPHGNEIVVKANPDKDWGQEIRSKLSQFMDGTMSNVTILCEESQLRININDKDIEEPFRYRYPLDDVAFIRLEHGSVGSKWIALSGEFSR
jgi:hypothetical protein